MRAISREKVKTLILKDPKGWGGVRIFTLSHPMVFKTSAQACSGVFISIAVTAKSLALMGRGSEKVTRSSELVGGGCYIASLHIYP